MEDQLNDVKRSADARLEHINVADGDGYIRWYIFNRGSEANRLGADDDNVTVANQAECAGLYRAVNWIKSTLLFWR